jgi:hypothetical protein
MDFERFKHRKPPPPPCPRTASWQKYARCELKGEKLQLLDDRRTVKLVAYTPAGQPRETRYVQLIFLTNGAWMNSGFFTQTNTNSDLVSFKQVGDRYRLDLGYSNATWVTTDEISTRPAVVKGVYTYFCSPTNGCASALTACDVLVHGKAIATFRATAAWNGNTLELRGDGRATNRYCQRPPNLIEDPLE